MSIKGFRYQFETKHVGANGTFQWSLSTPGVCQNKQRERHWKCILLCHCKWNSFVILVLNVFWYEKFSNFRISSWLYSRAGLSSEEKLHGVKYIIESFVGCIRNIVLSSGKAASDLLPITPLIATKHENVKEGCFNKCHSRKNLCFIGSRCINHYHDISCDCFGTHYEGEQCDIYSEYLRALYVIYYISGHAIELCKPSWYVYCLQSRWNSGSSWTCFKCFYLCLRKIHFRDWKQINLVKWLGNIRSSWFSSKCPILDIEILPSNCSSKCFTNSEQLEDTI